MQSKHTPKVPIIKTTYSCSVGDLCQHYFELNLSIRLKEPKTTI